MSPSHASAISAFFAGGGQIAKVQESIPATTQDVLNYFQSCGVAAKLLGERPENLFVRRETGQAEPRRCRGKSSAPHTAASAFRGPTLTG